jgi:hypothetical protein
MRPRNRLEALLALSFVAATGTAARAQTSTGNDSAARSQRAFVRSPEFIHPTYGDPYFNVETGTSANGQVSWTYNGRRIPSVERLNGNHLGYMGYNENGSYLLDSKASTVYLYDETGSLRVVDDAIAKKLVHGESGSTGLFNNPRNVTAQRETAAVSIPANAPASKPPVAVPAPDAAANNATIAKDAQVSSAGGATMLTYTDASGNKNTLKIQRPASIDNMPASAGGLWVSLSNDKTTIRIIKIQGSLASISQELPVGPQTLPIMPKER